MTNYRPYDPSPISVWAWPKEERRTTIARKDVGKVRRLEAALAEAFGTDRDTAAAAVDILTQDGWEFTAPRSAVEEASRTARLAAVFGVPATTTEEAQP